MPDSTERQYPEPSSGGFFTLDHSIWEDLCSVGIIEAVAYLVLSQGDNGHTSTTATSLTTYTNTRWDRGCKAIARLKAAGMSFYSEGCRKESPGYEPLSACQIANQRSKKTPPIRTPQLILHNTLLTGADRTEESLARLRQLLSENSGNPMSVRVARFAPMRRLLSGQDEDYLIRLGFRHEASSIRTQHRKLFLRFVDMLQEDFRTVHAHRRAAMAEDWDFETLLKEQFTVSYYLWRMRAAALMHLLRIPQATRVAQKCFDRIQPIIAITPELIVAARSV